VLHGPPRRGQRSRREQPGREEEQRLAERRDSEFVSIFDEAWSEIVGRSMLGEYLGVLALAFACNRDMFTILWGPLIAALSVGTLHVLHRRSHLLWHGQAYRRLVRTGDTAPCRAT
jgi:hypothetical protein